MSANKDNKDSKNKNKNKNKNEKKEKKIIQKKNIKGFKPHGQVE